MKKVFIFIKYISIVVLLLTSIIFIDFLCRMNKYGVLGVNIPTMLGVIVAVITIIISSITYILVKMRIKKIDNER